MTSVVLLAPGPSLTRELVNMVRDVSVGVVNNAFELAPWANFLVASDAKWWKKHPAAHQFAGHKFCAGWVKGVHKVVDGGVDKATNSGLLAIEVARRHGFTRMLLLGYDMHGTHFFGPYSNGLANTKPEKFELHQKQFEKWARRHSEIEVINCTPGSALRAFPKADITEALRAIR